MGVATAVEWSMVVLPASWGGCATCVDGLCGHHIFSATVSYPVDGTTDSQWS